jgi:hypothetical protein
MKKLIISCSLIAAASLGFAQGTVQFSNGALSRISLVTPGVSTIAVPTSASLNFGLFYGISQSTSLALLAQPGMNSTSSAGVIVNPSDRKTPMVSVPIPGTTPGETDVWIQIKGWDSSFGSDWQAASLSGAWYGESSIRNVYTLGPTIGPGWNIWQGATGTIESQIPAFALTPVPTLIPEPSMVALVGLGAGVLTTCFRRR